MRKLAEGTIIRDSLRTFIGMLRRETIVVFEVAVRDDGLRQNVAFEQAVNVETFLDGA